MTILAAVSGEHQPDRVVTVGADLADAYAFDEERQAWLRDVNPWALESITATLLEAIDRGLWDADPDVADDLRDINLSVEGDLEAATAEAGEVTSDD